MLADRLRLSRSVRGLVAHLFERWDGHGPVSHAKGQEIPLPMRIVHVAVDAAFQRLLGGEERVVRLVRERGGHAFDPDVVACLTDDAKRILAVDAHASVWEEALACEPHPPLLLAGEALDRGLAAIQNAYRKIGVPTRAAATLFAMEHGLMTWGEFPISRLAARP